MVGRDVYTANLIIWAQLESSYGAPTKREVLLLYQQGGFPLPTQKPVMHSQPPSLRKRHVLGGEKARTHNSINLRMQIKTTHEIDHTAHA